MQLTVVSVVTAAVIIAAITCSTFIQNFSFSFILDFRILTLDFFLDFRL